ncbi:hypothetical protein [Kiritimatiella glycovorans]|uniref:Uncharacterized protein n=1 Tax=Kiritimatiella glycovorans TaxID=1307763 RepID=A0A0G3EE78_9BACT|nr:hypothetical protein [Kiritimatiella glycovorans]AKJ64623.1 hypothetical protein L21SP4_01375 [Kiritimatiella glycovorans]
MLRVKYMVLLLGLAASVSAGQGGADNFDARIALKVVDPEERPVHGAEVTARVPYWSVDPYGERIREVVRQTGPQGGVMIRGRTSGALEFDVDHPAYYAGSWSFAFRARSVRQQVVLKPKKNPVPMIALRKVILPFPAQGEPLGFDLVKVDWLPPHGEGEVADIRLSAKGRHASESAFRAVMQARFPGEHNGILPMDAPSFEEKSSLRSAHEAPRKKYRRRQLFEDVQEMKSELSGPPPGGWYFRIRSRTDDRGRVGGLYGKIYGNPVLMGAEKPMLRFEYLYIQPEFNSRNVEFDPSRNVAEEHVLERWHKSRYLDVEKP